MPARRMKPADELRELIRGHRIPLRDKCADLLDECERVLAPFAEAARNGEISGRPPFQFCGAEAYANARATLAKLRGEA